MADNKKKEELGALWKRESNGTNFYSGKITIDGKTIDIVCFANGFKDSDNKPDIKIYKSEPR